MPSISKLVTAASLATAVALAVRNRSLKAALRRVAGATALFSQARASLVDLGVGMALSMLEGGAVLSVVRIDGQITSANLEPVDADRVPVMPAVAERVSCALGVEMTREGELADGRTLSYYRTAPGAPSADTA